MRRINCYSFGAVLTLALIPGGYMWATGLPADKYHEWSSEKEIFVQMRDGTHLSTDVLLPKGSTGKLATVLIRTPYDKDSGEITVFLKWLDVFLKQGYAVVLQSERGRFFSEGYYNSYLRGASTDGYDAIDWIVKQPWSNGKIGTVGCSSSGEQQWPLATGNHPAHAAMIPAASGTAVGNVPGNETRGTVYRGGVPVLGPWTLWYHESVPSERLLLPPNATQEQRIRLRSSYSLEPKSFFSPGRSGALSASPFIHLPSKDILRKIGGPLTPFDNYVTWTPGDKRWDEVELISAGAKPRVPALHLSTWHDISVGETTRLFKYLQDLGTPNQYLIIGAGPHCAMMSETISKFQVSDLMSLLDLKPHLKLSDLKSFSELSDLKIGDVEIGDARYGGVDHGYTKLFLNWFGYWLNGDQNEVVNMPKVQLFVMGKGWISGDQWPLKETRFTKYYLDGDLASRRNPENRVLSPHIPSHDAQDSYVYDPSLPVPSDGGSGWGAAAVDQRSVEVRKDVLVYSTPPLDQPLIIAGPITVVLYVSSSAKDTDFIVKLIDVYPDGKSISLNDDAFRVRYREGFDKTVLMQPGNVYKLSLSEMVTAIRLPQGHRIRLEVSSSSFPLYERNLNTGGNNYDETTWVVAENSVHYGHHYPSHVILPVLPD